MSEPSTPPFPTPRWRNRAAAASSAAAAALLVVAMAWGAMWVGESEAVTYRVGLLQMSICRADYGCQSGGLSLLGKAAETWGQLGAFTFAVAALAVVFDLLAAGFALGGRPSRWYRPRAAALVNLLVFSLAAVFTVAEPATGLVPGGATYVLFAGAAIGIASGVALHIDPRRPRRPRSPRPTTS